MKLANETGLTFHWPERPRISLLLPGFIVLSLFLHALAFYIFQVVYPPSVSITPPPAQVGLLMHSNADHHALLRWVEAEDPALVSSPSEATPPGLLKLPYHPSYAEVHATPQSVEDVPQPVGFPPAKSPLALVNSAIAHQQRPVAPIPAPQTRVRFSDSLAQRAIKRTQPVQLATKTITQLAPTRFLVGVTDRGEVRYTFLQAASGDQNIDQQAEAHLEKIEFAQTPEPMTWGFATYIWGNETYAPQLSNPDSRPSDPR